MNKGKIQEILLQNGFTIKPGNTDLKPYVYEAVREIVNAKVTQIGCSVTQLFQIGADKEAIVRKISEHRIPAYSTRLTGQFESAFDTDLREILEEVGSMLSEKNRKYGDAALNPQQVFAKCDPIELINVRIDDKINRIKNQQSDEDEDAELDLLGYLIIKQIAKKRNSK